MLKLYRRFLNLVDASRPRIRRTFKKVHSLLAKLFRGSEILLLMLGLLLCIILYSGAGLLLSAGPTFGILESSSFFSWLSIFAVVIYVIFKAFLPKQKRQNHTVNWTKIFKVLFVSAYVLVYWSIDKRYGQGEPLLAVGNACTVIGVTSIFVEMLLEECSSLRSQKKAMNVSSEEQKGQEH